MLIIKEKSVLDMFKTVFLMQNVVQTEVEIRSFCSFDLSHYSEQNHLTSAIWKASDIL